MMAERFKRGPITDDERKRRMDQNLCLYCGGPDHKAAQCPKKPKIGAASAAVSPFTAGSQPATPAQESEN